MLCPQHNTADAHVTYGKAVVRLVPLALTK